MKGRVTENTLLWIIGDYYACRYLNPNLLKGSWLKGKGMRDEQSSIFILIILKFCKF